MKNLKMWFLCLLFLCHSLTYSQTKKNTRPNIIFFLVDDMGWMDTSQPFGDSITQLNKKYHTPNMERLAKEGIIFTNAYANPVCTPTRTSLLTGVSAARSHITQWVDITPNNPADYEDDSLQIPNWNVNGISPLPNTPNTYFIEKTLPQLLKEAGYHTIHVGKAHFGSQGTPGSDPLNLGAITNIAGGALGSPQNYYGIHNFGNELGKINFHCVPNLQEFYGQDIFLTEALTIKAKQALEVPIAQQRPFFLYFGHYAVHIPIQPDLRFVNKYYADGLDSIEAAYASLIEGMDKSLGDMMDFLKEKKIDQNTIIIFMSDNGGLSDHLRGGIRNTHNLPLRAGKGSMYEGGIRIPMIVKWPQIIKPQTKTSQYIIAEDFFPTVLEMAGIKSKSSDIKDGKSYVKYLKNPSLLDTTRALVFHYPNRWTETEEEAIAWASAIRLGDWKLVYLMKRQKLELYNITADISEKNDLSKKYPQKTKELAILLGTILRERKAQMPIWKTSKQQVKFPDEL